MLFCTVMIVTKSSNICMLLVLAWSQWRVTMTSNMHMLLVLVTTIIVQSSIDDLIYYLIDSSCLGKCDVTVTSYVTLFASLLIN